MADRKQSSEFLGGGPKFNVVGKDNRPVPGQEEPVVATNQRGHWMRLMAFGVMLVLLVAVLLYLNDQNIGKTEVQPAHSGQAVSPDAKNALPSPDSR